MLSKQWWLQAAGHRTTVIIFPINFPFQLSKLIILLNYLIVQENKIKKELYKKSVKYGIF